MIAGRGTEIDAELRRAIERYSPYLKSVEADPTGLAPSEPGAKLDAGKPLAGVLMDFSQALSAVVDVGTYGAKKYSRGGWRSVPNGVERYTDAMFRHLLKEQTEPNDPDTGLLHAAHAAWNALARLELMLQETKS